MSPDVKRFDTDRVRALYDEKARTWKWMVIPTAILGLTRRRRLHFSRVSRAALDIG